MCDHRQLTTATNVTVAIDEFGSLRGGDGYMGPDGRWRKAPIPSSYARVVFCSRPTCEKVFVSERHPAVNR